MAFWRSGAGARMAGTIVGLIVALAGGRAEPGLAQDTSRVRPPPAAPAPPAIPPGADSVPDSLRAGRLGPSGAFLRSLLVPGWGQSRLNRKLTAGIFLAWEGVTLGMSLKTYSELRYLRATNSGRGDQKARQHEDWLILLAFNHLLSGLEAYVSAHLTDFPGDLRIQAVPGGRVGASLSIPLRRR